MIETVPVAARPGVGRKPARDLLIEQEGGSLNRSTGVGETRLF